MVTLSLESTTLPDPPISFGGGKTSDPPSRVVYYYLKLIESILPCKFLQEVKRIRNERPHSSTIASHKMRKKTPAQLLYIREHSGRWKTILRISHG
jgi:hypothetical protein